MEGIADRITEVIQDKSVSQKEFAGDLGFTPGYINDILRGRTTPSIRVIERMTQVYEVSADWLLTGKGPKYGERRGQYWPGKVEVVTLKELLDRGSTFGRRRHDFVAVPVFDSETVDKLPRRITNVTVYAPGEYCIVPHTWIKRPKTTFCHQVEGICMAPTVPIGSIAAVDCSIRTPSRLNGKLCLIRVESTHLVRRLRITAKHLVFETDTLYDVPRPIRIRTGSENPIIGKVEWVHCFHK